MMDTKIMSSNLRQYHWTKETFRTFISSRLTNLDFLNELAHRISNAIKFILKELSLTFVQKTLFCHSQTKH